MVLFETNNGAFEEILFEPEGRAFEKNLSELARNFATLKIFAMKSNVVCVTFGRKERVRESPALATSNAGWNECFE